MNHYLISNSSKNNLKILGSFLTGIFWLCSVHLSGQDTLQLDFSHYSLDKTTGLVVCNAPLSGVNNDELVQTIQLDQVYELEQSIDKFELGTGYKITDEQGGELLLYFSELPLIKIYSQELIVDEPRVLADFSIQVGSGESLQSLIGIEYKGGWTQSLAKKSFRIEFWNDSLGVESNNVSLLGMRSDDDWNLEAMFNEPLRIRNVTNAVLWKNLHTPYYLNREPEAKAAIALKYVELFLDDKYHGVYALSERIDRKLLQLEKSNEERKGELYKAYSWGASTFGSLPSFDNLSEVWGGYEQVYPAEMIEWEGIYDFTDFVINGGHEDFYEEWDERFERSNAIDYFIFLNAIRALDNTGKNIYLARYDDGEPYFYVPFDLDGTYGVVWDGTIDDASSGILSNGFYDRLLTDCNEIGFSTSLRERWEGLRQDVLSSEALKGGGEVNHMFLAANGVYEREELAWSSYSYSESNFEQFTSWIDKRMQLLDNYFDELCQDVAVSELSDRFIKLNTNLSNGQLFLYGTERVGRYSCKLFNSLGQLTYTSHGNSQLDLSFCPDGSYLLLIEYEGQIDYHPIFIAR